MGGGGGEITSRIRLPQQKLWFKLRLSLAKLRPTCSIYVLNTFPGADNARYYFPAWQVSLMTLAKYSYHKYYSYHHVIKFGAHSDESLHLPWLSRFVQLQIKNMVLISLKPPPPHLKSHLGVLDSNSLGSLFEVVVFVVGLIFIFRQYAASIYGFVRLLFHFCVCPKKF